MTTYNDSEYRRLCWQLNEVREAMRREDQRIERAKQAKLSLQLSFNGIWEELEIRFPMFPEVRKMNVAAINRLVLGKSLKEVLQYDWIDYYPVIDANDIVVDVISGHNAPESGYVWNASRDCYEE